MRLKAISRVTLFSLLLATSACCYAQGTNNPEALLSYNGQQAVMLAQELIRQKKYPEALKEADKAIKTDPKAGTPYMVKAFIYDLLGETKKAAAMHSKAVALTPNNGYVRNAYAAHLCEQKQYVEADNMFLLATQDRHYPFAYQALENAAQCAFENDDLALAEQRARSALAVNTESSGALLTMAQIKFKQSKFFEARAFIQRLESLGPLSASILKLALQIEKSAGDDRAAANYQKQLELISQAQIQPPTGEGQKKP
jgi:type IV pilus assembly protein PilF